MSPASVVSFETRGAGRGRDARGGSRTAATLYPWLVACDERRRGARLCLCLPPSGPGPPIASPSRPRVYVADGAHRRGIGTLLYRALLPVLEAQGFAQAIAAITLPNEASVRLHERLGFRQVGTYEKVGFKFGEWRSVGLWQRALAPLSTPAGGAEAGRAVWKPASAPPPCSAAQSSGPVTKRWRRRSSEMRLPSRKKPSSCRPASVSA